MRRLWPLSGHSRAGPGVGIPRKSSGLSFLPFFPCPAHFWAEVTAGSCPRPAPALPLPAPSCPSSPNKRHQILIFLIKFCDFHDFPSRSQPPQARGEQHPAENQDFFSPLTPALPGTRTPKAFPARGLGIPEHHSHPQLLSCFPRPLLALLQPPGASPRLGGRILLSPGFRGVVLPRAEDFCGVSGSGWAQSRGNLGG